jgi:hypothetical protein
MGRADVLPEAELAAGHEDSAELAHGGAGIPNAAQEAHDDGGVEGSVLHRQSLGDTAHDLDRDRGRPRPLGGARPRRRVGLDCEHARHLHRVMLERASVAGADLDHTPAEPREQPAPELTGHEVRATLLTALEEAREARLLRAVQRGSSLSRWDHAPRLHENGTVALGPIAIARGTGPRLLLEKVAERTWGGSLSFGLRCDLRSLPERRPARIEITMEPRECPGYNGFADELARVKGASYLYVRGEQRMCDAGVRTLHVATAPDGSPAYTQWLVRPEERHLIDAHIPGSYSKLEPGEVLLEGAYTFSRFRGMSLMADGMSQLLAKAREGGADSALTYVATDNVPSLRGCAAVGFAPDHLRRTDRRLGRRRNVFLPLDRAALELWAAATAPRPLVNDAR